ncbi:MAG: PQQ-binding-like beta-propeller repeat protein [Steroidobacteraceae bacterium]
MSSVALAQSGADRAATGRNVDWPTYSGDIDGSFYSPLNQINASNFSDLEVAWSFSTTNLGNRPEFKLEGTPIEVGGVLYATGGNNRDVVALNATTGELLWVHGEYEGARGAAAPRQISGRGLAYWSEPGGRDARILYVTPGYFLIALNAKTGQRIRSFGDDGRVDLKRADSQRLDPNLTTANIGYDAAPTVVGNEILIGSSFPENFTPNTPIDNKGVVFALDVRTGRKLWQWDAIPKPGQPGYNTWLKGSAAYTGNCGIWDQITADPKAGLAYVGPAGPTNDYYGGQRPGDGKWCTSLVALNLKTGKMKWGFQLVHHELWDFDVSAGPLLLDINVEGRPIKAVALPSKQGYLYVFNRLTGKPVWPMPETRVPQGNVPGEWYSPTQPIPSKPAPYSRGGVTVNDLIDFTPQLREKALQIIKNYKLGPRFTPSIVSQEPPAGKLGVLSLGPGSGGTNWPGGSFNPATHTVFVYACNACLSSDGVVRPPANFTTKVPFVRGEVGQQVRMIYALGFGTGAAALNSKAKNGVLPPPPPPGSYHRLEVDGLPLVKPPYNLISAINLDTGDIEWQVPLGNTPDYVRNNPALKGLTIPRTGQASYNVGTLVTQTLVIAGDPMVTITQSHPRGAMLRAFDQRSGRQVGDVLMPAHQSGTPMTYMIDGKQYLIVAVSGGDHPGEYICYTLPSGG